MKLFFIVLTASIFDTLLGDHLPIPHPVQYMGCIINMLEKLLRSLFPPTKKGEKAAGTVLVILVCIFSYVLVWGLLVLAGFIHPIFSFVLETWLCYRVLAARSLADAARDIYQKLPSVNGRQEIESCREAVGKIVGRDVKNLNETELIKAGIESVSENTSDGIIAPLLFIALGGAPLGFLYKAVNTIDSMLGYKNTVYLYFGWAAARLDDVFNFIPSRISALSMITASAFLPFCNADRALRIYLRDRKKHTSPNAAQTESACAGALGIQLGGPSVYQGIKENKAFLGDPVYTVEAKHLKMAEYLTYGTYIFILFLCLLFIAVFSGGLW